MEKKGCFLCQAPCDNVCPHCESVKYCSEEHFRLHRLQFEDKENHGDGYCCPFEVSEKPVIGRVLVATRNIKPMELILVDPGTCTGPNYTTKQMVCLECTRIVNRSSMIRCSGGCDYPMCSFECANRRDRHSSVECEILARCPDSERPKILQVYGDAADVDNEKGISGNAYSVITPLRMLLMMDSNCDKWKRSNQLMDHIDERLSNKEEWEWYETTIVDYFRNKLRLPHSTEQIHHAIGLLNVNAVKLQFPKNLQKTGVTPGGGFLQPSTTFDLPEGKGLYPIFAIMSHYCVCNARYTINPDTLSMYVRSRIAIPKGEEISVQYLSALYGNFKRRKKIREQWYFDCVCRRCRDPSECGSRVSAIKCEACLTGDLLPIESLDPESMWKCGRCGHTVSVSFVEALVDSIEEELDLIANVGDFDKYLEFIESYSDIVLHPHHYLIMIATRNLIQYYTYSNEALPTQTLRHKHQLCRNFANVLAKIDPGFSEIKTFILKELHFSKLLLSQRDLADGKISRDEYLTTSRQSLTALGEVEKHKAVLTQFPCG